MPNAAEVSNAVYFREVGAAEMRREQAAEVSEWEEVQQAHESVPTAKQSVPTAKAEPSITPAANGSDCTHPVLVVRKLYANFEQHVGVGHSVAPMTPPPRLPHRSDAQQTIKARGRRRLGQRT